MWEANPCIAVAGATMGMVVFDFRLWFCASSAFLPSFERIRFLAGKLQSCCRNFSPSLDFGQVLHCNIMIVPRWRVWVQAAFGCTSRLMSSPFARAPRQAQPASIHHLRHQPPVALKLLEQLADLRPIQHHRHSRRRLAQPHTHIHFLPTAHLTKKNTSALIACLGVA